MLTVHELSKSYGIHSLFKDVTFNVTHGERAGLVGPNGCGKTTLLRIIAGEERADNGHVTIAPGVRIGYLAQALEPDSAMTVGALVAAAAGDAQHLQSEVQRLALALAATPRDEALAVAYDRALQRLSTHDPGRAPLLLQALGLDSVPADLPLARMSGGQKTRLALALLLLDEPDLLLLDEPTNHLDVSMLQWLEEWLISFSGAVLLVSHDRAFLDRTVAKIVALDATTHTAQEYTGNYSDYIKQLRVARQKQWDTYRDQEAEIGRLRQDVARVKQQAQRTEMGTNNDQLRRYAKKVARKAKSREKRLHRYLESPDRVEKPARRWQMKLDFHEPQHVGQEVLVLSDLAVGYEVQHPLLRNLNLAVQGGHRVTLVGPNGSGKTTLLRTIAGQIPPLGGHFRLGAGVSLGYMTQEQKLLDPKLSALQMVQRAAPLNETEARSFLHYFLFSGDDPLRPAASLSFGERARLALALLVARGCNFLLLDEPINHLDIPSRDRFEEALAQFAGTVLAVVHDRYFIQAFATDVWSVQGSGIEDRIC